MDFAAPKTLADAFRYRREIGIAVCVESLRAALNKHQTTPADIAKQAMKSGVWKVMLPYLEALTING